MKKDILDQNIGELKTTMGDMGQPAYRAAQVFSWIHKRSARTFQEMTDIPRDLANTLDKKFRIGALEIQEHLKSRKDRTEKFLWKLEDDTHIESVLLTSGDRKTLCLSTQVGCRFRCPFCASGTRGFKRNLSVSEIVDQVLFVQHLKRIRINNIVFMGMGEPLDNFDHLERAIKILNDPAGLDIGARKITVSTCGIVPGIKKLSELGLQIELSVSLHSLKDEVRNTLVPANKKYPLERLINACEEYTKLTGRQITFEYALIKDLNDSVKEGEELGELVKSLKAKVNLIACNPTREEQFTYDDPAGMRRFISAVRKKGCNITVRTPRGTDIAAGCGQLAARAREK